MATNVSARIVLFDAKTIHSHLNLIFRKDCKFSFRRPWRLGHRGDVLQNDTPRCRAAERAMARRCTCPTVSGIKGDRLYRLRATAFSFK